MKDLDLKHALLRPAAIARIEDALTRPNSYAHREFGEDVTGFRAKAVANALTYDDEELAGMGLGVAAMQGEATQGFAAADERWPGGKCAKHGWLVDGTCPGCETEDAPLFRTPELDRSLSGVSYHNRPLWVDAPVAFAAAIVASVALVLAVIALMM